MRREITWVTTLMILSPPGEPSIEKGVFQQDGGRHGAEGLLSGLYRVHMTAIDGKIRHGVVQEYSGTFGDEGGAEEMVDRFGYRDKTAFPVAHGVMGGIPVFEGPGIETAQIPGVIRIDAFGQAAGVLFGEYSLYRYIDETGIRHVSGAIGIYLFEYFGEQMKILMGIELHTGDIEGFEDIECLDDVRPAGAGGR